MNIWLITVWDGNEVLEVIPLKYDDNYSRKDIVDFAIKEGYNNETLSKYIAEEEKMHEEVQRSFVISNEVNIYVEKDGTIGIHYFNHTADITINKREVHSL